MLGYLRSGNKRTKAIWLIVTIAAVVTFLRFQLLRQHGLRLSRCPRHGRPVSRSTVKGDRRHVVQRGRRREGELPAALQHGSRRPRHALRRAAGVAQPREPAPHGAGKRQKSGLTITDNDVIVGMHEPAERRVSPRVPDRTASSTRRSTRWRWAIRASTGSPSRTRSAKSCRCAACRSASCRR